MKINKRLIVGLAVAIAALAVTASSASAAEWKHGQSKVQQTIQFGLTGGEVFEIGESGMSCENKMTLDTSGGSTGTITAFQTVKCGEKPFGEFKKCELNTSEPLGLPWTVHVISTTQITITNWKTKRTFKGAECPFGTVEKQIPTVTLTPQVPSALGTIEYEGSITGYRIFGSLTVDSPNDGTYGIG